MFDILKIQADMMSHLLAIGTVQGTNLCRPDDEQINLPNSPDKATGKKPYIDVSFPFATTTKRYDNGSIRQTMLMQIDVVGEAGQTDADTMQVGDIVSSVMHQFSNGTVVGSSKTTDTPSLNSTVEEDGDYRVSLTVPFSYNV